MTSDIETIVSKLSSILREDSDLKSFEILPQPHSSSEPAVLYLDHHLGLASWCLKDLYRFIHDRLRISTEIKNQINYLSVALLLNPNVKTYWNARKKLVLSGDLDVQVELNFVTVILSHKPKAQDLYHHRKWLLSRIFEYDNVSPEYIFKELEVIRKAATQHTNNHIAWSFACWLLRFVKNGSILHTFWKFSQKWISTNVSDFSGLHFHQQILLELINCDEKVDDDFKSEIVASGLKYLSSNFGWRENSSFERSIDKFFVVCLIIVDLELNENLITFYGHHESLWNHRRFLSYVLAKMLPGKLSEYSVNYLFRVIRCTNPEDNLSILLQMIDERFLKNVAKNSSEHHIKRYHNWMRHLEIYSKDTEILHVCI